MKHNRIRTKSVPLFMPEVLEPRLREELVWWSTYIIHAPHHTLLGLRMWLRVEQEAILIEHLSLEWIGHPNPTYENFKLLIEFIVNLVDCF